MHACRIDHNLIWNAVFVVVDLNSGNIDLLPNMTSWSSFHNGVAAGLKIAPASQVDSAWIAYNKPKSPELANEYAGFLMALGLNGHLTKLATLNIHDYLTKVSMHANTGSAVEFSRVVFVITCFEASLDCTLVLAEIVSRHPVIFLT